MKNYDRAIDLSKQQALDAGPRTMQQINFTRNLDGWKIPTMQNKTFLQGTVGLL